MGKKDEKAFHKATSGQSSDVTSQTDTFTGESPVRKGDEDIPQDKLVPGEVPKDKGNFRGMSRQGD